MFYQVKFISDCVTNLGTNIEHVKRIIFENARVSIWDISAEIGNNLDSTYLRRYLFTSVFTL